MRKEIKIVLVLLDIMLWTVVIRAVVNLIMSMIRVYYEGNSNGFGGEIMYYGMDAVIAEIENEMVWGGPFVICRFIFFIAAAFITWILFKKKDKKSIEA